MKDTHSYQFLSPNGKGNDNQMQSFSSICQTFKEGEENLSLSWFLTVVSRRMLLILAVAISVTAGVGFGIVKQEPRYVGKFQLLVEPIIPFNNSSQLVKQGSDLPNGDYQTKIELLRSYKVLKPIIKEIYPKYPEITYKNLIDSGKITIGQHKDTKIIEVSYEDSEPEKIQFILNHLAQGYLKYSLGEQKSKLNQKIKFVREELSQLQERVDSLQIQLQKFREQYNFLDPQQQAHRLSNQLIAIERKYFDTQVQINEVSSLYSRLETQSGGLGATEAIAASYLSESSRYQNLLKQLQNVEIKLALESARFMEKNPTIVRLKEQKQNLLLLLRQEAELVLGNNFSVNLANSRSLTSPSSLRLHLNQQLIQAANQIPVLETRKLALEQAANYLNKQLRQMPILARQYNEIQRELNLATEKLKGFLETQQNLQMEAVEQTAPWQLLSEPEQAPRSIYPNSARNWGLGVFAGLILGLGAALVAERINRVFHSREELEDRIKLPIVGIIPFQESLKSLDQLLERQSRNHFLPEGGKFCQKNTNALELGFPNFGTSKVNTSVEAASYGSPPDQWYNSYRFLEAFSSCYTNIQLLDSDSLLDSLVITSAAQGEGKSTVALHLAQTAAVMGKRVLLVEADLRRPQIHHWLNLPNQKGLSDVISTHLELELAMQKLPQWENLYVLTSGDLPPNPTRILASGQMQKLMAQLKEKDFFDLVIYDTPPVLGFADAKILGKSSNGVILVVKMGKTDRSLVRQGINELRMSLVPVLGVVANSVHRNRNQSYYYD
ncbi:MAG: polysaccharide biosynthesis tyrosine autokinase [Moorea sp. SIO2B7]|nr:polysaccharide biosynthesis tyrosine autokinase [Moorena sp. SIO2B7]